MRVRLALALVTMTALLCACAPSGQKFNSTDITGAEYGKDFKLTDGKGIGVVVELSGGGTTWFFDDEITAA